MPWTQFFICFEVQVAKFELSMLIVDASFLLRKVIDTTNTVLLMKEM